MSAAALASVLAAARPSGARAPDEWTFHFQVTQPTFEKLSYRDLVEAGLRPDNIKLRYGPKGSSAQDVRWQLAEVVNPQTMLCRARLEVGPPVWVDLRLGHLSARMDDVVRDEVIDFCFDVLALKKGRARVEIRAQKLEDGPLEITGATFEHRESGETAYGLPDDTRELAVAHLRPGKHVWTCTIEGYPRQTGELSVVAGQANRLELRVLPGGSLTGQVKGALKDRTFLVQLLPATAAQLALDRPELAPVDALGSFSIDAVLPGPYKLALLEKSGDESVCTRALISVRIEPGATATLTLPAESKLPFPLRATIELAGADFALVRVTDEKDAVAYFAPCKSGATIDLPNGKLRWHAWPHRALGDVTGYDFDQRALGTAKPAAGGKSVAVKFTFGGR